MANKIIVSGNYDGKNTVIARFQAAGAADAVRGYCFNTVELSIDADIKTQEDVEKLIDFLKSFKPCILAEK